MVKKQEKGKPAIQQVCDEITQKIVLHEFKPGMRLTEQEICDNMGVGRSTARNALESLSNTGLVELIPNVGARVTVISREQLVALLAAKNEIQSVALGHIFDYFFDVDFIALEDIVARENQGIIDGKILDYLQAIEEFHNYIVDKVGNEYLSKAFRILSTDYTVYQLLYDDFYDISYNQFASNRCHPQIIEGIKEQNIEKVRDALSEISRVVISRYDYSHHRPSKNLSGNSIFR